MRRTLKTPIRNNKRIKGLIKQNSLRFEDLKNIPTLKNAYYRFANFADTVKHAARDLFHNNWFAVRIQPNQFIPWYGLHCIFNVISGDMTEMHRFKTGVYGLTVKPAQFQKTINCHMIGVKNSFCILDDIWIDNRKKLKIIYN